MGVTQVLADWVAGSRLESLPAEVIHEGKRTFLNFLGLAIGASRHEAVEILLDVARTMHSPPLVSVLGRSERCGPDFAAMASGIAAHVEDFDDTHLQTVCHPAAPVAPAALALAEWQGRSGADLLLALILGCEVELRVGKGVCPGHLDQGWHVTATIGNFGAAAAAGKLLDLSAGAMAHALGLAATQAGGLQAMVGSMSKSFHPGKAAANGLLAAQLAARGFTSSTEAIEARRGFARVTGPQHDFAAMTEGLGSQWELRQNTYKPFACGIVSHPAIDGAITLKRTHGLNPAEITGVEVEVHPLVLEAMGRTEPGESLQGKFSVYHCVAVGLIDGAARLPQFTDARVRDPEVVGLRRKVRTRINQGLRLDECRIRVDLTDGRQLDHHVEHAVGSAEQPLSDTDLTDKFVSLVEPVLPARQVRDLVSACWSLEGLTDLRTLIALSRP